MTRLRLACVVVVIAGWAWFEVATDSVGVFVAAQTVSYIAFEQITVAASSIGFTTAKILPDGAGSGRQATTAMCRLEAAEVRYTVDGTTPTSAIGTLLEIGDYIQVNGFDSLTRFRAIRTGAVSGVLDCTYSAR